MRNSSTRLRLAGFGLSAGFAVYIGFCALSVDQSVSFVRVAGYWFVLLPAFLLTFELIRLMVESTWARPRMSWQPVWSGLWRHRIGLPILFVFAATCVIWLSQPRAFKIIMDEPVLAATSMMMHLEKEVLAPLRGYTIEGVFLPLNGLVDKRPLFFPFVVSLLHDLTGYRANQTIILNALLLPLFLGQCFVLGSRICGRRIGGYLAIGIWATVPLLAMVATSGGFDLLNLIMILFTAMAAERYLAVPGDRQLNILLLLTVLLAQTRYESILFVFATGAVVAFGWWRERRIHLTWTAVLVPLLLIVSPIQRSIMNHYEGFWQLPESVTRPFSLSFVPENLVAAVDFSFAMNDAQPNSWLLTVVFLLSTVVLGQWLWRKRRSLSVRRLTGSPGVLTALAFGGIILVNFIILMTYHWGQVNDIVAARLVLPVLLVQVLSILLALRCFRSWFRPVCLGLGGVLVIFFFSVTRPVEARTDFMPWGFGQQFVNWLVKASANEREANTLWITDRHLVPILNQAPAFRPKSALAALPELELHRRMGTFEKILVVQLRPTELGQEDHHPALKGAGEMRQRLNDAFELELEQEIKLNDLGYLRLMRVTAIRVPAAEKLSLSGEGVSVDYTGRMDVRDPALLKAFVESLPR